MSQVIIGTEDNFFNEINTDVPALVDFWAEWCGPCRAVSPIVEEIAAAYAGKLKVLKVNVDENQELASRYGIMSIPTLLFIKNGEEKDKIVGAVPRSKIEDKVKTLL
jgi:thioredoxin 1